MGYTHHWTHLEPFTDEEWRLICSHFQVFLDAIKKDQRLFLVKVCPEGNNPIITEDTIMFNGPGALGCETMYLTKEIRPPWRWEDRKQANEFFGIPEKAAMDFCKTRRLAYDMAVCVLLLIAYGVAPKSIKVSTDGTLTDWLPAIRWVQNNLPIKQIEETFKNYDSERLVIGGNT